MGAHGLYTSLSASVELRLPQRYLARRAMCHGREWLRRDVKKKTALKSDIRARRGRLLRCLGMVNVRHNVAASVRNITRVNGQHGSRASWRSAHRSTEALLRTASSGSVRCWW